jgi:Adenylate cyclase, family 3 (some proteins contain HAMP domain)
VIHVLGRFYHHMDKAVIDHGGHVACYTGDGLLALFGIETSKCACLQAVLAGLDMLRCVKQDLQPYVKRLFRRAFRIGIGLHFGQAVVGTLGGGLQERITAIGDAVNVASRVERANKKAKTEFLVTEAALREVRDQVYVGRSIDVNLPGKTGRYTLHEIVGVRDGPLQTPGRTAPS